MRWIKNRETIKKNTFDEPVLPIRKRFNRITKNKKRFKLGH